MGLLKLLQLCVYIAAMLFGVLNSAESVVLIRFDRAPPAQSRFSTAVFWYRVEGPDGFNACKNNVCSIYCELDGESLRPCPADIIILKNLTVNQKHKFLLNVTTREGKKNSSAYSWFIDTIPPTATIFSKQSYTNAEKIAIDVTFSEACTGQGGFKCFNSSNCDVMVDGPGSIQASSLRIIKPNIKYSLNIILSLRSRHGHMVINMADKFCTDEAGNRFTRTNGSIIIIHFDRRPVQLDLWTSVPAYELGINGVPRTVLATNKMDNLEIFLHFSNPIANSTAQISKALDVNSGTLIPIHSKNHGNRRFAFKLKNISETEIITVNLQAASVIGRAGTPVSPVAPITFLYDSIKPGVVLSTSSPKVTKESNINVIVEFTKPVFGFGASVVEVEGGRLTRFEELSRALYFITILAVSHRAVSVIVPAGKVNDISGNLNLASNILEVKHYSAPAISTALHSFVTAGVLSTSLAAALLSLSSANLGAIGTVATLDTNTLVSDSSMNLHGMVGHLQVFALSDWLSVSLPVEYSETIKGLMWLIPREKLPWKKKSTSVWPNHFHLASKKPAMKFSSLAIGYPNPYRAYHLIGLNSTSFSSILLCGQLCPTKINPKVGWLHGQHNLSLKNTPYGLSLNSNEYFIYFLRGEPLSASNVIKRMENNTGWQDLKMNLFWLSVGGGSLLVIHFLILIFLRWRTGTSAHGILLVPRFELFLLILMLPCISQSSAFVIRGGTTGGIMVGTLLLAIPAALILSVSLFLIIAIYPGSFVQYKEVKHTRTDKQWYIKLWAFFTGRPTMGKWFYREGLPSSFLAQFGILFDSFKGPPLFVLVDQTDPNYVANWIESQSGIGRMKAISSDDSNEETKVPMSKRVLGCAKSSYVIMDLLRRVSLGIISGAYPSQESSQRLLALIITLVQFVYLFTLKPYIIRRVHVVESVSLLCEAGIFGLSTRITGSNPIKERTLGFVMLTLLFVSFVSLITNEWYTLIKWLLRINQPQKNSLKLGLKCAAKGLILPFLPRKQWSRVIHGYSQPKTGLVPNLPQSQETGFGNTTTPHINPLSAMTAIVVPVLSPGSPGLNTTQRTASTITETQLSRQTAGGGKQPKGLKMEPNSELKKLRELAKASFSGNSMGWEGSTSYGQRMQSFSVESSSDKFQPSSSKYRN